MKKLRWPLLVVLLALVAIGVPLYSQYNQRQQISSNETPNVSSQVKPAQGGIYTEGLIGSFNRLNPVLDLRNSADRDIDRLIFSGLIRYDDRGLPQGDLAESWGISQDGKVYNFSIRPNAVWHDGEQVTADDIVFTVDLMRDENSTAPDDVKALWKEVEVIALDPKMIQFRLPEPYAPFLDYLSFGVLPKHILDGKTFQDLIDDPFNLKPVGSGPYRLERFAVTDGQITGVVLASFHDYYGQKPFIEQFVIRYFPDAQSAFDAYKNGEVMGISQVPSDLLPQVLKDSNLSIQTGRLPELSMVYLNLDNPDVAFFQEPDVRRALLLGLNRQWMIDHLLAGQAIIADGAYSVFFVF
jgi:peptide/nickel transport system substrate-binding protein